MGCASSAAGRAQLPLPELVALVSPGDLLWLEDEGDGSADATSGQHYLIKDTYWHAFHACTLVVKQAGDSMPAMLEAGDRDSVSVTSLYALATRPSPTHLVLTRLHPSLDFGELDLLAAFVAERTKLTNAPAQQHPPPQLPGATKPATGAPGQQRQLPSQLLDVSGARRASKAHQSLLRSSGSSGEAGGSCAAAGGSCAAAGTQQASRMVTLVLSGSRRVFCSQLVADALVAIGRARPVRGSPTPVFVPTKGGRGLGLGRCYHSGVDPEAARRAQALAHTQMRISPTATATAAFAPPSATPHPPARDGSGGATSRASSAGLPHETHQQHPPGGDRGRARGARASRGSSELSSVASSGEMLSVTSSGAARVTAAAAAAQPAPQFSLLGAASAAAMLVLPSPAALQAWLYGSPQPILAVEQGGGPPAAAARAVPSGVLTLAGAAEARRSSAAATAPTAAPPAAASGSAPAAKRRAARADPAAGAAEQIFATASASAQSGADNARNSAHDQRRSLARSSPPQRGAARGAGSRGGSGGDVAWLKQFTDQAEPESGPPPSHKLADSSPPMLDGARTTPLCAPRALSAVPHARQLSAELLMVRSGSAGGDGGATVATRAARGGGGRVGGRDAAARRAEGESTCAAAVRSHSQPQAESPRASRAAPVHTSWWPFTRV
ncbi:hypothetical protein FOA52_012430 [Chlamydomonas sp. UWO 241]|nr:hypothetical protein FOA52_012430 [Chlamydomonas sp. UWO 241]